MKIMNTLKQWEQYLGKVVMVESEDIWDSTLLSIQANVLEDVISTEKQVAFEFSRGKDERFRRLGESRFRSKEQVYFELTDVKKQLLSILNSSNKSSGFAKNKEELKVGQKFFAIDFSEEESLIELEIVSVRSYSLKEGIIFSPRVAKPEQLYSLAEKKDLVEDFLKLTAKCLEVRYTPDMVNNIEWNNISEKAFSFQGVNQNANNNSYESKQDEERIAKTARFNLKNIFAKVLNK